MRKVLIVAAVALVTTDVHTQTTGRPAGGEWQTFVVTAYDHDEACTGHTHGITKSGAKVQVGVTAACEPNLLGRKVWIAGIGKRVCQDTGSKVGHKHIDLYVETHEEALQFGKQLIGVRVLQ